MSTSYSRKPDADEASSSGIYSRGGSFNCRPSAFSLDTAVLCERGEIGQALFYVLGSVVFSIPGLFAGLALVRHLT